MCSSLAIKALQSYRATNMLATVMVVLVCVVHNTLGTASWIDGKQNITVYYKINGDASFDWEYNSDENIDFIRWWFAPTGVSSPSVIMAISNGETSPAVADDAYKTRLKWDNSTPAAMTLIKTQTKDIEGVYSVTVSLSGTGTLPDGYTVGFQELKDATTFINNLETTVTTTASHDILETDSTSHWYDSITITSTDNDKVMASTDMFDVTHHAINTSDTNDFTDDGTNTGLLVWQIALIVTAIAMSVIFFIMIILLRYFHTKDKQYSGRQNTSERVHRIVDKERLTYYSNNNAYLSDIQQHHVSKINIHQYDGSGSPAKYSGFQSQQPHFSKALATYARHSPQGIVVRYTGTSFNHACEPYPDYRL